MESLREPVYKNYSSGEKKRETFPDAQAALETAQQTQPLFSQLPCKPGAAQGHGARAAAGDLSPLNPDIHSANLELKQQVGSFQECSLHLQLHHDL